MSDSQIVEQAIEAKVLESDEVQSVESFRLSVIDQVDNLRIAQLLSHNIINHFNLQFNSLVKTLEYEARAVATRRIAGELVKELQ